MIFDSKQMYKLLHKSLSSFIYLCTPETEIETNPLAHANANIAAFNCVAFRWHSQQLCQMSTETWLFCPGIVCIGFRFSSVKQFPQFPKGINYPFDICRRDVRHSTGIPTDTRIIRFPFKTKIAHKPFILPINILNLLIECRANKPRQNGPHFINTMPFNRVCNE